MRLTVCVRDGVGIWEQPAKRWLRKLTRRMTAAEIAEAQR